MRKKRFIVYDIETNGGKKGFNQPVEICASSVNEDGNVDKFHVFLKLRDGFIMNSYVSALTGISESDLLSKGVDFREGMRGFIRFINDLQYDNYLCGHNIINSDNLIIRDSLIGIAPIDFNPLSKMVDFYDTAGQMKAELLGMVKFKFESYCAFHKRVLGVQAKGVKYSMTDAMQHYLIPQLGKSHRADSDVYNCLKIFGAQIERIKEIVDQKTGEIEPETLFKGIIKHLKK